MLLADLVTASAALAATRSRLAKREVLAGVLRAATPTELPIVVAYLAGGLRQRRTGVGWRGIPADVPPAAEPTLTVSQVDEEFEALAALAGPGSANERGERLRAFLARATSDEQRYLGALIVGETRQGAVDGLMQDAIAAAAGVPVAAVRRAVMVTGSTAEAAHAALMGGEGALAGLGLQVGVALRPMLASSAKTVAEGMVKAAPVAEPVSVETKLDGIRVQVHKSGTDVRVFTRSLDEITSRVPEIVAAALGLPARTAVLDGEALSLAENGRPRPFQETASRSMTLEPSHRRLSVFFFDALELDGRVLLDAPLRERREALASVVPSEQLVEGIVTADPAGAEAFSRRCLDRGHEGVVIKNLDAPYEAGRRGATWVKVKPVRTLDLVVLAVEWGSGRRKGWLSNIHLGARDPSSGGFVMLGKTFKGMTDAMLAWQTERFLALADGPTDGWVVRVRPEQVVEIAFDGLQRSTRYPGGLALRFARVLRYRDDKTAAEADTIDSVRDIAGPVTEAEVRPAPPAHEPPVNAPRRAPTTPTRRSRGR